MLSLRVERLLGGSSPRVGVYTLYRSLLQSKTRCLHLMVGVLAPAGHRRAGPLPPSPLFTVRGGAESMRRRRAVSCCPLASLGGLLVLLSELSSSGDTRSLIHGVHGVCVASGHWPTGQSWRRPDVVGTPRRVVGLSVVATGANCPSETAGWPSTAPRYCDDLCDCKSCFAARRNAQAGSSQPRLWLSAAG